MNEQDVFTWAVCVTGYSWKREPVADPVLLPRSGETRRYAPMTEAPALFLELAEVDPDADAIAEFASRRGPLGVGGDSFESWNAQRWDLRRLTRLWEAWRARDEAALARHVLWRGRGARREVVFTGDSAGMDVMDALAVPAGKKIEEEIASREINPSLLERFTPGDLIGPAREHLVSRISGRLAEDGIRPAGVALAAAAGGDGIAPAFRPTTLAGAAWCQFASAVASGQRFLRCATCGKILPLTGEVARRPRLYCGDSCRVRAHQLRQVRARQLHAHGKSFEKIARALGSDVPTVRKWITGRPE